MNDRFKFRVWDVQEQKYMFFDLSNKDSLSDFGYFATEEAPDYNEQIEYPDTNCWSLIIEQCTGLKDKNGKFIYEGDIIELTRSRNYGWCRRGRRLKVQWNTFNCCGFGFGAIGNLTTKCAENCIVIGNIHETPDLLGNGK